MVGSPGPADVELCERAVLIARQVGDETVELHARCTLGTMLVTIGREQEGQAELNQVLARSLELQDPDLLSRTHVMLSDMHEGLGRSAEAATIARAGCLMTRINGMLGAFGTTLRGNLVESLLSLGGLNEAADLLATAPADLGSPRERSFLSRLRCMLALRLDDLPEAARQLALSVECLDRETEPFPLPLAELSIRLATAEGRFDDARTELLRALRNGFQPGKTRYVWPLLVHGVAAEADARGLPAGAPGRADVLAQVRAAAGATGSRWPLARGWSLLLAAELARAEGRADPALYRRAVQTLESTALPYPLSLALVRAAESEAALGNRVAAAELLDRAEAPTARHGDLRLTHEAALLARRARLRSPSASVSDAPTAADCDSSGFGLTPRELGVLGLVARGWSNRQVAEELYISPKTASVHVSNILAKLGASSRGEAAAMAHRLHLIAP